MLTRSPLVSPCTAEFVTVTVLEALDVVLIATPAIAFFVKETDPLILVVPDTSRLPLISTKAVSICTSPSATISN